MESKVFRVPAFFIISLILIPALMILVYGVVYLLWGMEAMVESFKDNIVFVVLILVLDLYFMIFRIYEIVLTSTEVKFKRMYGKTDCYKLADLKEVAKARRATHFSVIDKSGKAVGYNLSSFSYKRLPLIIEEVNNAIKGA